MALTGYCIAAGWVSADTIDDDQETYDIGSFAVQADMDVGREWFRPGNTSDVARLGAEYGYGIMGNGKAYGGVEFTWEFRYLTPKMVKYISDTFFDSGGEITANVTVRTKNRSTGEWEYYQCVAQLNDPANATPAGGGYDEYKIKFVNGVKVIPTP